MKAEHKQRIQDVLNKYCIEGDIIPFVKSDKTIDLHITGGLVDFVGENVKKSKAIMERNRFASDAAIGIRRVKDSRWFRVSKPFNKEGTFIEFPEDSPCQEILREIFAAIENEGEFYASVEIGYWNRPYQQF